MTNTFDRLDMLSVNSLNMYCTSAVSLSAAAMATVDVVQTVRKLKKRLLNTNISVLSPTAPNGAVPSLPMIAADSNIHSVRTSCSV